METRLFLVNLPGKPGGGRWRGSKCCWGMGCRGRERQAWGRGWEVSAVFENAIYIAEAIPWRRK